MKKEIRINVALKAAFLLLGCPDGIGSNRKGFDSQPTEVHVAQAMAGGLWDHQNIFGLKAQEPAAEGIKADGIGRGHNAFGAAQLARAEGAVFSKEGRASEMQRFGFLTRFRSAMHWFVWSRSPYHPSLKVPQ